MNKRWRAAWLAMPALVLASGFWMFGAPMEVPSQAGLRVAHQELKLPEPEVEEELEREAPTSADCSYLKDPQEFLMRAELHRQGVSSATEKVAEEVERFLMSRENLDSPIPRKNFIDDAIFGRMEAAGIQPAPGF